MRREGADQVDVKKGIVPGAYDGLFTGCEFKADHPPHQVTYPGRMLWMRAGSREVGCEC
jgi:hypothetical protein